MTCSQANSMPLLMTDFIAKRIPIVMRNIPRAMPFPMQSGGNDIPVVLENPILLYANIGLASTVIYNKRNVCAEGLGDSEEGRVFKSSDVLRYKSQAMQLLKACLLSQQELYMPSTLRVINALLTFSVRRPHWLC